MDGSYIKSRQTCGPKKTAVEIYDDIRKSKTDVESISKHYDLKPERIQTIKDYVFNNPKHTPQNATAEAWQRLSKGIGTEQDKLLLKHETVEMFYNDWIHAHPEKYLKKYDPFTSHDISNIKGFNWEEGIPTD
jgi:hypothetical protein